MQRSHILAEQNKALCNGAFHSLSYQINSQGEAILDLVDGYTLSIVTGSQL